MSIRRIESAYATFFNDKKINGSAMSVLIALAYVANEKKNELCFPSDKYLSRLTHFRERTINSARNRLRSRKIIDWISGKKEKKGLGGNESNRYWFLFDHRKMTSQRESYQQLSTPPTALDSAPTALDSVPYGKNCRTLRKELPPNTEITRKKKPELKAEEDLVPALTDSDFKFEFGGHKAVQRATTEIKAQKNGDESVTDFAMRVCGVSDFTNKQIFSSVMARKDSTECIDVIMRFASEKKQGENKHLKNPAAVLTTRLAALPNKS